MGTQKQMHETRCGQNQQPDKLCCTCGHMTFASCTSQARKSRALILIDCVCVHFIGAYWKSITAERCVGPSRFYKYKVSSQLLLLLLARCTCCAIDTSIVAVVT